MPCKATRTMDQRSLFVVDCLSRRYTKICKRCPTCARALPLPSETEML